MIRRTIYDSKYCRVFSVGEISEVPVCVTFFTYASDEETLANVSGFSENLLTQKGIPALHFINLQNHWWQIPDLKICLEAANIALAKSGARTGYGSSMGAYAALRFSKVLGLEKVLGFVPQFSINRQLVPFEKRWARPAQNLLFFGEPFEISNGTECHIVLGNNQDDRKHLDLIIKNNRNKNITVHYIDAGDHLILRDYQEKGILRPLASSLPEIDVPLIQSHPDYISSIRY